MSTTDRSLSRRTLRSMFRSGVRGNPNQFVKRIIRVNNEEPVIRGAYGRVVFGTVRGNSEVKSDAARVVVKMQHVYDNEAVRRREEIDIIRLINSLCSSHIPNLLETFYVWTWPSKTLTSNKSNTLCIGMVMEAADTDMLCYLNDSEETDDASISSFVISCTFQIFATNIMLFNLFGKVHRDLKVNNCLLIRSKVSSRTTRAWGKSRAVRQLGWMPLLADFGAVLNYSTVAKQLLMGPDRSKLPPSYMWRYQMSRKNNRYYPRNRYVYVDPNGRQRLHGGDSIPGVLPVWSDLIQWLSSLLVFVEHGRSSRWRVWCERALRLGRWFEECTNLAYVRTAHGTVKKRTYAMVRLRRTKPSSKEDPDVLRVTEDAHTRRLWTRAATVNIRLREPDINMIRAAIIRDTRRFCNIIFSTSFLKRSGVAYDTVFDNTSSTETMYTDYDHSPVLTNRSGCDNCARLERSLYELDLA